jgi:hypothetical protein
MIQHGGRQVTELRHAGAKVQCLIRNGRVVFVDPELPTRQDLLEVRIAEEDGENGIEKWFEVGFNVEADIWTGNAAAGFNDRAGLYRLDLMWSEDLENWSYGKFSDCADSPLSMEDGTYDLWARSCYPIDSQIKTGVMFIESCMDDRRQPFTALTINSTVIALPNFPYHMPADAAQLQTDLRAAGWSGSTVAASGPGVWRIDIPNTEQTDFSSKNYLYWPGYYVPDLYGQLSIWVDGYYFSGAYTNLSDVRTALPKQFARIAITNLKG